MRALLRRRGAAPRSRTAGAALLLTATLLAGCGSPGADPSPPSPSPDSPVQLCTRLISYWAEQDIIGSKWAGLDWEQKGLSNEQFGLYDDIVQEARGEQRRRGTDAALELLRRRSAERCKAANGATHSSENWRPPA
ncbi:hypothetical protein IPZ58_25635 [Streptomyces roseoverticillatus]|uniref:hypothetical protein n=1 Tax=Streptomyces roseoverticillatus TaxID=66429 RepID=UPI001F2B4AEA|nr:hypothetical protein [Streptomyces roseoverticillatus]MCF3104944.1 hypothetical protein [Streptomyces roseoverticillatus]